MTTTTHDLTEQLAQSAALLKRGEKITQLSQEAKQREEIARNLVLTIIQLEEHVEKHKNVSSEGLLTVKIKREIEELLYKYREELRVYSKQIDNLQKADQEIDRELYGAIQAFFIIERIRNENFFNSLSIEDIQNMFQKAKSDGLIDTIVKETLTSIPPSAITILGLVKDVVYDMRNHNACFGPELIIAFGRLAIKINGFIEQRRQEVQAAFEGNNIFPQSILLSPERLLEKLRPGSSIDVHVKTPAKERCESDKGEANITLTMPKADRSPQGISNIIIALTENVTGRFFQIRQTFLSLPEDQQTQLNNIQWQWVSNRFNRIKEYIVFPDGCHTSKPEFEAIRSFIIAIADAVRYEKDKQQSE
ncbi:MAG: hypothetical protein ABIH48_02135 [Candidatus Falkowbacteria bacterium]